MSGGFPNKPRILRGAFVEYGLSLPPLFVVFQFNPLELTRNRSLSFSEPNPPAPIPSSGTTGSSGTRSAPLESTTRRRFYDKFSDLLELQKNQVVTVQEESIGFDIRLDATDKLDEGDAVTEQFGISPQLATLELMMHPKGESLIGRAGGFSFTKGDKPPMILFIWGRKRVLPVNINSLSIKESEFSADLNPIRATVSVKLTVIEGQSAPYLYSKAMKEAVSALNLANRAGIADVVIPG